MSDTKNKKTEPEDNNYREIKQPKADSVFSEPNDLKESLDNLNTYENWSSTDIVFQNPEDATTPIIEKHTPYKDADKATKVKKKAMGIGPIIPIEQSVPSTMVEPKKKPKIAPIEEAFKGRNIDVKAAKTKEKTFNEIKKVKNVDLDELLELLKDSDVYSEYLGLGDIDFENNDEDNTDFPMDDKVVKKAEVISFAKNNPVIPPDFSPINNVKTLIQKQNSVEENPILLKQKRMRALLKSPHRLRGKI